MDQPQTKKPSKTRKKSATPPYNENKIEQRKAKKKPPFTDLLEGVNELKQERELGRISPNAVEMRLPKQLRSGPLYQKGAVALAEKVKGRKPLKAKSRESLSSDEIVYPLSYGEKAIRKKKMIVEELPPGQPTILAYDTCAGTTEMKGVQVPRLPNSKMPILTCNNCNDKHLFVDNMPFWWNPVPSDITDDEIVMNAAVIIDVLENRLKLVPMPDIQIVLDPVEDVSVLQERDTHCFTKDIIFGNTVRSMVNLNELSLRELHERSVKKFRPKHFPSDPNKDEPEPLCIMEPKTYTLYSRDDYTETFIEDFTPTKRGRYSKETDIEH